MASRVVYWDASALVAALFSEIHTVAARDLAAQERAHLISSLAWVEVQATLARAIRDGRVSPVLVDAAEGALRSGPWTYVSAAPKADLARSLARRWPLRGADLWHLTLVKTLQEELPELVFATYDSALVEAAIGEGVPLSDTPSPPSPTGAGADR